MSIKVVNLRDYKVEKDWVLVKVDRSSVLGNPFRMVNERDRSRVCDEYEKYFMKRIKEEGDFRNEVIRIYKLVKSGKNVALGCWCFPRRCHALVIKRFIESCLEESKGSSNPLVSLKDIIDTELCYIDYNAHVNLVRYGTPIPNNVQIKCKAYQYALNKLSLTIEDLDRYFVGYEYPLNEAEQAYDTWRRDAINFLVNKFLKASK